MLDPLLAFLLSAGLLWWLLRSGRAAALALDRPNDRSLHSIPTPRVGGLGIVTAAVFVAMLNGQFVLVGAILALALVSWLDDRGHVAVRWRLAAHCLVAGWWLIWLGGLPWWSAAILALALVWAVNLYNFMDGANGLAGGMAVFGFGAYGVAAWLGGDSPLAATCLSLAAAAAGFLIFNFPQPRVFMGDAGSIPLGFAMGALGVQGWLQGRWPIWFPVIVFSPFVVDATATLLKRLLRGERIWQAHREHYYQRLVRMGWSHRKTALAEYAWMAGMIALAFALLALPTRQQLAGLAVPVLAYAVAMAWIDRRWACFEGKRT